MSVSVRPFGSTRQGEAVRAYTISNELGASATLLDYGATVQSLCIPNRDGGLTDVVLGYDSVGEYETHDAYIGATVGRFANRLGGARFSLNGREYTLAKNNGDNCLHGGVRGFNDYVWKAEMPDDYSVSFSRLSPNSCNFGITYEAVSDADTLVNLTNHSYFDLSGCGRAMEQTLCIHAERYLELGAGTLPTGQSANVSGTPFDFLSPKPVGRDLGEDDPQLRLGGGYDHNFCLSGHLAAEMESAVTGIRMEVFTTMPGMQLYTANFLGDQPGKGGRMMHDRCAVALETQLWPDAMNHWGFPSPVLRRGETLISNTCYNFSTIM